MGEVTQELSGPRAMDDGSLLLKETFIILLQNVCGGTEQHVTSSKTHTYALQPVQNLRCLCVSSGDRLDQAAASLLNLASVRKPEAGPLSMVGEQEENTEGGNWQSLEQEWIATT